MRDANRDPQGYLKKITAEFLYAPDRWRAKLLWFLKAPCQDCYRSLRYRHFTCLTCFYRRSKTEKGRKELRYVRDITMHFDSVSGKMFPVPKNYCCYGLICKTNVDGKIPIWKIVPLKLLMTLAERIAEW